MPGRQRDWRGKWDRLIADSKREVSSERRPFPTDAQLDLLKAALLPAEEAAPAWRRWKARGLELQTVADHASMRLFPQLFVNRDAAGMGPEDLSLLKGICRHTIAYNAATLANGLKVAQLLEEAGIPVLFIKGAAIVAMAGRTGHRQIEDVDVLVPETDAERAIALLLGAGYSDAHPGKRRVGFGHAWSYRAPTGQSVDLHWWAFKTAGDDSGFFALACDTELLGRGVRTPCATDCLVLTVANAFQVGGTPLRWIADAMWIFGNAEIDWELLLQRASRPGVTPGLTEGLSYLAREFKAPVPPDVLYGLVRKPVSWQARLAYWSAVNHPVVGAFTLVQFDRHRARRGHFSNDLPRDFFWYMANATGGRHRRDLIGRALRRSTRSAALLLLIGGRKLLERPMRRV